MIRAQSGPRWPERRRDVRGLWERVMPGGLWVLVEASEAELAEVRWRYFGHYVSWTVGRA